VLTLKDQKEREKLRAQDQQEINSGVGIGRNKKLPDKAAALLMAPK
jgi:hypothetical protein